MEESDLLRRLMDEEADAASYYTSELAKDQADLHDRYYNRPFGNERPDRSQVVTPDVMDAINWTLPSLLRPFLASEDFIVVESPSGGDTSIVADYISHVFFKDNDGNAIIHDFAFDGLEQRVGIIQTCWDDPQPGPPKTLEGVGPDQLVQLSSDPEYEILSVADSGSLEDRAEGEPDDAANEEPSEAQIPQTFTVEVRHTPRMGRVDVSCVAPEDFRISRRAKSIETANYHCVVKRAVPLAELQAQFPEKAAELAGGGIVASETGGFDPDIRVQARHRGEAPRNVRDQVDEFPNVDLLEEYLRCDCDGDGIPELRAIKRVGSVILENVQIDEPEVSIWSPIRVAHRAIGLSLADTVVPYQKIRTELTRRALDNMAQVLIPRKVVNMDALDSDDPNALQRIIDGSIGAMVPVRGDARAAVSDLVTPDVSSSALGALNYFDQRKQEASGVNAQNQGIDPAAANKTATGIDLLQSASNARIEIMARWLAVGLEGVFNRILKLICQHQDQPRVIKLRGRPMEVNPAMWPGDMMASVHVGMANATRERQIANLTVISGYQEKIISAFGPSNPICGVKEARATLARLAEAMGYKAPEAFFKEIPQEYQPPEPGPDPRLAEVQSKQQLAQAEAQHKATLAEQQQAHQQELERMRVQSAHEMARIKAESDERVATIKVASEAKIAAMRTDQELIIARERMAQEIMLAKERMQMEMDLSRQRADREHEIAIRKSDGEAKINGFRPGGKLDA